jgi:glycerol-3-phosphate dehydrogenase
VEHLLNRYGSMAEDLLAIIAADPAQAETLPGNPDYLLAEVTYAVTHEGALHIEDVLSRRTRFTIETRDRGMEAAAVVGKIMGTLLGWSAATEKKEVKDFRLGIEAELAAEQQTTDEAANAIRTAAPSITEMPV